MRELKFRFWDTRNDEWCDIASWMPTQVLHRFTINDIFRLAEKDGIIAQQFTGLRDRDNSEIYEGDIVAGNSLNFGPKTALVEICVFGGIVYKDLFGEENIGGYVDMEQCENKITGNIFEGVTIDRSRV
jgi:hypothetical protein